MLERLVSSPGKLCFLGFAVFVAGAALGPLLFTIGAIVFAIGMIAGVIDVF